MSFSLGGPLWLKLQLLPVSLANLGLASAFGMKKINAKAMSAATKAPLLNLKTRPSKHGPAHRSMWKIAHVPRFAYRKLAAPVSLPLKLIR